MTSQKRLRRRLYFFMLPKMIKTFGNTKGAAALKDMLRNDAERLPSMVYERFARLYYMPCVCGRYIITIIGYEVFVISRIIKVEVRVIS